MKRTASVIGVATVVASVLAACGHDDHNSGSTTTTTPPTPPPSTTINVTTAELLANYASQPSETAAPLTVNGGAFNITDTSEITTPISVNGT
jgi:hypothetical protein